MKGLTWCLVAGLLFVSAVYGQTKMDPPVPIRTVAPKYPLEMKRQGTMGVVVVKCTIDEQGNVVEPEVEKSTNEGFNTAAVEAVKKWKFKPAMQNGAAVAKRVSIPIKFVSEG